MADRLYIVLCTMFSILIVLGNMTYQKFVTLPLVEVSVGVLFYPFTYLLSDLIAEFYGKEKARFCVRLAIAMNIMAALLVTFMGQLDATEWSTIDNKTFQLVFGSFSYSFIGSIVACYISQFVDIFIYLKLKKITAGRMLWLRNFASTSVSLLVDTVVVVSFLTMLGIFPYDKMWPIIANSYAFKLTAATMCVPVFCLLVRLISLKLHPIANISAQSMAGSS